MLFLYLYCSIEKCGSKNRDWLQKIFIKFLLISIMNFFHYYKMYFTLNALQHRLQMVEMLKKSVNRLDTVYVWESEWMSVYSIKKTFCRQEAHQSCCTLDHSPPPFLRCHSSASIHTNTHIFLILRITTRIISSHLVLFADIVCAWWKMLNCSMITSWTFPMSDNFTNCISTFVEQMETALRIERFLGHQPKYTNTFLACRRYLNGIVHRLVVTCHPILFFGCVESEFGRIQFGPHMNFISIHSLHHQFDHSYQYVSFLVVFACEQQIKLHQYSWCICFIPASNDSPSF